MIGTMRVRFSKGDMVRYISHLDLQRLFGRALRRANIPVAYSQGFNPHPRLSFGSALSVGITSESEYIDVDLAKEMNPKQFAEQMNEILPPGLRIEEARFYNTETGEVKLATLMSVINGAEYEIVFPIEAVKQALEGDAVLETSVALESNEGIEDHIESEDRVDGKTEVGSYMSGALDRLKKANEWTILRDTKKKIRELDIKPYVCDVSMKASSTDITLNIVVQTGSEANVRPGEVVDALQKYGQVPQLSYQIHRKKLGIMESEGIVAPFPT